MYKSLLLIEQKQTMMAVLKIWTVYKTSQCSLTSTLPLFRIERIILIMKINLNSQMEGVTRVSCGSSSFHKLATLPPYLRQYQRPAPIKWLQMHSKLTQSVLQSILHAFAQRLWLRHTSTLTAAQLVTESMQTSHLVKAAYLSGIIVIRANVRAVIKSSIIWRNKQLCDDL